MWANRSGIQGDTVKKIGLAWILTLPAAILISATLFTLGGAFVPGARVTNQGPSPALKNAADPTPAAQQKVRFSIDER